MKKSEVQFHSDGFGYRTGHPAVNVKVYKGLTEGIAAFRQADATIPARYTEQWIRENLTDESINEWWHDACMHCCEQAEEDAKTIFGEGIKCWTEGRSGGWMVVDGLKDFDSWNAVDLAKWEKFTKWTQQPARDVPYQCVDLIYYNVFQVKEAEQDQEIHDQQTV